MLCTLLTTSAPTSPCRQHASLDYRIENIQGVIKNFKAKTKKDKRCFVDSRYQINKFSVKR